MRVILVSDPNVIKYALEVLRQGGVIVYPTETAYGLGGDWTKSSVHRKVRLIKGRECGKQFSVIVSSRAMAGRYVTFHAVAKKLAREHWPGPLSLVVPLRHTPPRSALTVGYQPSSPSQEGIPLPWRGEGVGTLSVRISPHPVALTLVRRLGRPLIATSANISGAATLYDARAITAIFVRRRFKPDLIIDAGRLSRVKPSTVVAVKGNRIEVLRNGPIKIR